MSTKYYNKNRAYSKNNLLESFNTRHKLNYTPRNNIIEQYFTPRYDIEEYFTPRNDIEDSFISVENIKENYAGGACSLLDTLSGWDSSTGNLTLIQSDVSGWTSGDNQWKSSLAYSI